MNPKGLAGRLKPPVGLIPPVAIAYINQALRAGAAGPNLRTVSPIAILYMSQAFRLGAVKYNPFDWNEDGKAVEGVTYYEAAVRHSFCWLTGEWIDPESGAPHLAHGMACGAILLDAGPMDQLIENRPRCASPALVTSGSVILGGRASTVDLYEKSLWHWGCWFAGEWIDLTTGCPHIACAMACMSRILEGYHSGDVDDDRPAYASASDLIAEHVAAEKAKQAVAYVYDENLDNPAIAA
ncbi:dATP/dGTP diphosphohydrolase domain-containing protein [Chenggangzhangella methanolivorans]|uniref:DUF5664 domain-containing protein n=1 Tax=Chenggangzhangella methanolivorans TaxID=1437009 RepID=A0A9E6UIA6_9HYPH|nr:dATP/dGTP diphosphohydrolase domain-containing protein [Chenggangzhangella methanolivorans]QZO00633.1 DUF5664 domain-containing protein [Chenggangzhangella methanolivorans]